MMNIENGKIRKIKNLRDIDKMKVKDGGIGGLKWKIG